MLVGPEPPEWYESNGCTYSLDRFWDTDWSEACRWHDWAYRDELRLSRKQADLFFLLNLLLCDAPVWWALFYWGTVRVMGWRFYHKT